MSKKLVIDSKVIMLNMWDTAGQERFRSITKNYYRNIDGVLLVFDGRTFACIDKWYNSLQKESPNTPLFLVWNISDQIPNIDDIRNVYVEKTHQMGMEFYATSAKENVDVSAIFEDTLLLVKSQLKTFLVELGLSHVENGAEISLTRVYGNSL
ncbi:uncharacterized protein LOC143260476 [Megalopta genalis]|uniref:uncharacterized protein LOC143260476 n=1 Tax=Megalopta genalis TaxID=115081 RepID=UPI003FD141CE